MGVWTDPLLKPIAVPDDLQSQWFTLGSARFQLLPSQYGFLAANEEYLGYIGGYGCKAQTAKIGGIPIPDWQGGIVDTTLGTAVSSRSYLKGKADLYIVQTESGQQTEVTLDHRFLTPDGWRHLRDLRVGDVLAVDGSADDFQEKGIDVDSLAGYAKSLHPYGGLSRPWQVAYRSIEQRQLAQLHGCAVYVDGQYMSGRPSRKDCEFVSGSHGSAVGYPIQSSVPLQFHHQPRILDQSPDRTSRRDTVSQLLHAECDVSCMPHNLQPKLTTNWTAIKAIRFKENAEFWDISVPGVEHYISDGFVDHNSGKTSIGAKKAAYLSMHPGNRGIIGMDAGTDLGEGAERDTLEFLYEAGLLKKAPTDKKHIAYIHCIDLETGRNLGEQSEIEFVHLDDASHVRGRKTGWFWIDEGSKCKATAWSNLIGRNRLPSFKDRYVGYVTGNPEGHNWIYDFFFNRELLAELYCKRPTCQFGCSYSPEGKVKCNAWMRRKRRAFHCTSTENYFLPPDYLDNMRVGMDDDDWNKYVLASFEVFSGQIFREWDEEVHVLAA